jgi:hypothetical protein
MSDRNRNRNRITRLDLPTGTTSEPSQSPWTHPPQPPCNTPSQTRRGLLHKRKRQGLVLVKRPLGPTQEPLAERHVRLDFPLLTGERVVLDAQQGVEREGGDRKLVRVAELVLRRREIEERGALLVGPTSAGG